MVPYPDKLLLELGVAPGVDDRVVTGAGHGHQVADEEHQVIELPTLYKVQCIISGGNFSF